MNDLMEWQTNVRKIGASLYTVLPFDYCKSHKVKKSQIVVFTLNTDGSLTLRIRDPVVIVNTEFREDSRR